MIHALERQSKSDVLSFLSIPSRHYSIIHTRLRALVIRMVTGMSATLKLLHSDRDYLLHMMNDLENQAKHGTISEVTYTLLHKHIEASLIRLEEEISNLVHHQDPQQTALGQQRPNTEVHVQLKTNTNSVTIQKIRPRILKSVPPRTKTKRVIPPPQNNATEELLTPLSSRVIEVLWKHQTAGRLLTAKELPQHLHDTYPAYHNSKDEVIDCLRRLVSEGRIKRHESQNRDLHYEVVIQTLDQPTR